MAVDSNPFGRELLVFLRQLARNNDKSWFDRNKDRYESDVREPALAFIRIMARHVERISPHLTAIDKKVGGSLMRVYRDVRFSKDKRPYKTNLGIQFRHQAGKDVHAPGLYVHVEPGDCFLGAGVWHPDGPALKAVREAIDADPKGWKRAAYGKRFRDAWEPAGASLKRPPRGFSEEHPFIEDLKRKDHIAICRIDDGEVVSDRFVTRVAERFARARPFMGWIAQAVGLPF